MINIGELTPIAISVFSLYLPRPGSATRTTFRNRSGSGHPGEALNGSIKSRCVSARLDRWRGAGPRCPLPRRAPPTAGQHDDISTGSKPSGTSSPANRRHDRIPFRCKSVTYCRPSGPTNYSRWHGRLHLRLIGDGARRKRRRPARGGAASAGAAGKIGTREQAPSLARIRLAETDASARQ
jgi:hypothetical protein